MPRDTTVLRAVCQLRRFLVVFGYLRESVAGGQVVMRTTIILWSTVITPSIILGFIVGEKLPRRRLTVEAYPIVIRTLLAVVAAYFPDIDEAIASKRIDHSIGRTDATRGFPRDRFAGRPTMAGNVVGVICERYQNELRDMRADRAAFRSATREILFKSPGYRLNAHSKLSCRKGLGFSMKDTVDSGEETSRASIGRSSVHGPYPT